MMFNVPQYIDVEDKVAGPLTAKQLLWMFGMGGALMMLWNAVPRANFWVAAIPVIVLFVAFAFYQPYGMPLIAFMGHVTSFLVRPKIYLWNRPVEQLVITTKSVKKTEPTSTSQTLTPEKVVELARILDHHPR